MAAEWNSSELDPTWVWSQRAMRIVASCTSVVALGIGAHLLSSAEIAVVSSSWTAAKLLACSVVLAAGAVAWVRWSGRDRSRALAIAAVSMMLVALAGEITMVVLGRSTGVYGAWFGAYAILLAFQACLMLVHAGRVRFTMQSDAAHNS